jgi:redox-sensitive bicupin YhaK (pirin superfamily)
MSIRTVQSLITAHHQREGGGFIVRRPFPTAGLDMIDPFLMLDEMGPVDYRPGEAIGAPDHPHRGFETITYILEGEVEHRDSAGHHGVIRPGGVQWMTAGRGVVHSEMPSPRVQAEGGRVHGFQIWLNLPRANKMVPPRYQERTAEQIPTATSQDGLAHAAVIAGEALGVKAAISTHTPIHYHHWRLQPGASVETVVPAGLGAFVYVFDGTASVEASVVTEGQVAVLSDGDRVRLSVPADAETSAQLLLLAGKPLNEPVARYGPFVMNYPHELKQAVVDFQAGRMGRIPAEIA